MQGAAGPAAEPAAKRARTAADTGAATHADCNGGRAAPDGDCAEGLEAAGAGEPGSGDPGPGDLAGRDSGRGLSGHADPGLEEGPAHGAPWLEDGVAAPLAPERAAACYVCQLAAIPGRRGWEMHRPARARPAQHQVPLGSRSACWAAPCVALSRNGAWMGAAPWTSACWWPPCWQGGPVCQARRCAQPLVRPPVCEAQGLGDTPLARSAGGRADAKVIWLARDCARVRRVGFCRSARARRASPRGRSLGD